MNLKQLIAVFTIVNCIGMATHASDIKDNLSASIWANRLDLDDAFLAVENAGNNPLTACFEAGKVSEKIHSALFTIMHRLSLNLKEGETLRQTIGESSYYNVVLLMNAISNRTVIISDYCKGSGNFALLRKTLVQLYRGHIAIYRILEPKDLGRALEVLNVSTQFTESEKIEIERAVKNTSELGEAFSRPLK